MNRSKPDLDAEHAALLVQTEELQREHDRLAAQPYDEVAHREHLANIRFKLAELHEHMRRLKGEAP